MKKEDAQEVKKLWLKVGSICEVARIMQISQAEVKAEIVKIEEAGEQAPVMPRTHYRAHLRDDILAHQQRRQEQDDL